MAQPKSLIDIAVDTLAAVDKGEYTTEAGKVVSIKDAAHAAISGTILHRPQELEQLLANEPKEHGPVRISVTGETTAEAALRMSREGKVDVLALNFASARNPGGGFLGGARAQEEDLCRASGLYPCLISQRQYYVANAATGSVLYSDHMIYSPKVPFFRERDLRFRDTPFLCSVLTAPAPALRDYDLSAPGAAEAVAKTLDRRISLILAAAEAHGHDILVLGAWGCGAFRNDPVQVADVFWRWLHGPRFAMSFKEVCFAVLDDEKKRNFDAFKKRFG